MVSAAEGQRCHRQPPVTVDTTDRWCKHAAVLTSSLLDETVAATPLNKMGACGARHALGQVSSSSIEVAVREQKVQLTT